MSNQTPRTIIGLLGRIGAGLFAVSLGLQGMAAEQATPEAVAAVKEFEHEVRAKGTLVDAADYRELGDRYYAIGLLTQAAGAYDQAVTAGMTDRDLLARLAGLWEAAGRVDRALPVFIAAAEAAPEHPESPMMRLRAARAVAVIGKDYGRAVELYQMTIAQYPGTPAARRAVVEGFDIAENRRWRNQERQFAELTLRHFPKDRGLISKVVREQTVWLERYRNDLLLEAVETALAEHPDILRYHRLGEAYGKALVDGKRPAEALAALVDSGERSGHPDPAWLAAEVAHKEVEDGDRAAKLYLAFVDQHPLDHRVKDAVERAKSLGADVSDYQERAKIAKLRHDSRRLDRNSRGERRNLYRHRGGKESKEQMRKWFDNHDQPLVTYPWEVLDSRCLLAVVEDDRDAYRKAMLAWAETGHNVHRLIEGLTDKHRVPGEWHDALTEALFATPNGQRERPRYFRELAEKAYRREDTAALASAASEVFQAKSWYWNREVMRLLLRDALRRNADEDIVRVAEQLYQLVQEHRGGHKDGDLLRESYKDRVQSWPTERRLTFYRNLLDYSHGDRSAHWPGARLVTHLFEANDIEQASWGLHRAIAACDSRHDHQFDAMMGLTKMFVDRGNDGVASGAYDHIARHFTRVDDGRRKQARRQALQAMTRLGGVVVEALMEIDEDDPMAPVLRAQALLSVGRDEEAYLAGKEALELMVDNAGKVSMDLTLAVADGLVKEKEYEQAVMLLQAWNRSNGGSGSAQVLLEIGNTRFADKDYSAALLEFQSVIASFPDTAEAAEAQLRIGDCYLSLRQFDEAYGVYEKVLNAADNEGLRAQATFRMALLEAQRGESDAALELFQEVARMNPSQDLLDEMYLDWTKVLIDNNQLGNAMDVVMQSGMRTGLEPIAPGESLTIILDDPYLHTGQNRSSVPVVVETRSGDREIVDLALSQNIKGKFTARLTTELGDTILDDGVLQVTGDDEIRYDYTEEFKETRKTERLNSGAITIAASGAIKAAANPDAARFKIEGDDPDEKSYENLGLDFDSEAIKRARELAQSASRMFRGDNHIKPGNPIYLAVHDPDQDISSGSDRVRVQASSSSGDEVNVILDETGPHTGLFKGILETDLMPPDIEVSDSAVGADKMSMLLSRDDPDFESADAAWVGAADLEGGKTITLDFKETLPIDRFLWSRGWALPPEERPEGRPEPKPGLRAEFFAGDLDEKLVHQEQGVPGHDNRSVPNHGRNNWAVRWIGEIRVPADGVYEFAARSDDGCRIMIRGEDIYGGEHWQGQGATTRTATVDMSEGWNRIVIEHNQGGGGSHLSIEFGPEGDRKPLTEEVLRARPAVDNGPEVERVPTRYRIETSTDGKRWTDLANSGAGVLPRGWLARKNYSGKGVIASRGDASDVADIIDRIHPNIGNERRKELDVSFIDQSVIAPRSTPEDQQAPAPPTMEVIGGEILIPQEGVWEFAVRSGGYTYLMVNGTMVVDKERDSETRDTAGDALPVWRGKVELPYGLASIRMVRSSFAGHSGAEILWRRPRSENFEPVPDVAIDRGATAQAVKEFLNRDRPKVVRLPGRYGHGYIFDPVRARFLRMVIQGWNAGDAPAVARVGAWSGKEQILPAEGIDYRELASNDRLELSAGDEVEMVYYDIKTRDETSEERITKLRATYYDGHLGFFDAQSVVRGDGRLEELLYERYRFNGGDRLTVHVVDYDLDSTDKPDEVPVTITSSANQVTVTAIETDAATGVFQGEVRTMLRSELGPDAKPDENVLLVDNGEQIIAGFEDVENLSPGVRTTRTATIREAVVSDGAIAIAPSRVRETVQDGKTVREPQWDDADFDATGPVPVALASLRIEVNDPDSVISRGSKAVVRVTTDRGASVDVIMRPGRGGENFGDSVGMVLGSPETTETYKVTARGRGMASAGFHDPSGKPRDAEPVVPMRGGEKVRVTYIEGLPVDADTAAIDAAIAAGGLPTAEAYLVTDGVLGVFQDDYETPVSDTYVGGHLFFKVLDPDADASDERDRIDLALTTGLGDELTLQLEETQSHSGVFMGSIDVDNRQQANPEDELLDTTFGDTIEVAYQEEARLTEEPDALRIPVSQGHDGVLQGFAKRFADDELAAMTHIQMAECYFEMYKTHRAKLKELEKSDSDEDDIAHLESLIKDELNSGTSLLRQTIYSYPELDQLDEVLFLLANFEQENDQQQKAIGRYRELLAGYPSSVRAPEAQYKMAQCFEELDKYTEAWDSYVRLAYRWPEHDLVADSMARIGNYYEQRGKEALAAARKAWQETTGVKDEFQVPKEARDDLLQAEKVYGQLVENYGDRDIAPAILLKQGNCHWLLGSYLEAEKVFASFQKRFPESPYLPTSLYWAGRSALEAGDVRSAYLTLGTLIRDFPETKDAKRARGMMISDGRLSDFSFVE